jgi:hypothetical protein
MEVTVSKQIRWNLPQKLVGPIACHHDPRHAKMDPLASSIVHFSDIVIRGLGYGHGHDIWVPQLSKRAWTLLGLSQEDLDVILEEVEEKLWDVRGFSLEIQGEPRRAAQSEPGRRDGEPCTGS